MTANPRTPSGGTPDGAYSARCDQLAAQLARDTESIGQARRDGHITSAEEAGMIEAAHKRHDTAVALARITRDYTLWETWAGVAGLLYARIPNSSPPVVVRAASAEQLRVQVHDTEAVLRARGDLL